jgi:predicted O-methyltransferase YrrM
MSRYTRPITRILRKYTRPLRDGVRMRVMTDRIQRSVHLADEDRTEKRRRWHVLVDLIHEKCPKEKVVMAEVGVRSGVNSAHILKYCPQIEVLRAVDIAPITSNYEWILELDRFDFIQGDSADVAGTFDDDIFDIVFVDADHSEASVRRDVGAWLPKVKPGGVIAGHDYGSKNHAGVKIAVDDIFSGHAHPIELDANKVWWTIR